MIRGILGLLTIFCLLTGCCCKKMECKGWKKLIENEEVSRIVAYFSAKMMKEERLDLDDSKVIYSDDHVEYDYDLWSGASYTFSSNPHIDRITLEYSTQRIVTMCEARLLLVTVVEEFLHRLNENGLVKYQLAKPFTEDNLDITINFETFYGRYVDPLYIGIVCLRNGMVKYFAFDIKNNEIDWSHQRVEPYFKSKELAYLKQEADAAYELPPINTQYAPSYYDDRYSPAYQDKFIR